MFSTMFSIGTMLKVGVVLHLVVALLFPIATLAKYQCLCNQHRQRAVYATFTGNARTIGYLYLDECKEFIRRSPDQIWGAVAYAHQIGYVKVDYQIQIMTCDGNPSVDDRLTTSRTVATSSTSKPTTTTVAPTQPSITATSTQRSQSTTSQFNPVSTTQPKQQTTTSPSPFNPFSTTQPKQHTTKPPSTFNPFSTTQPKQHTTKPPSTFNPFSTTQPKQHTTASSTSSATTRAPATTPSPASMTTSKATIPTTHHYASSAAIDKLSLCSSKLAWHARMFGTTLGQYGSKCYELFTNTYFTWMNGEALCRQNGGNLVSIGSPAEQQYLMGLLVTRHAQYTTWIGLNDIQEEGYNAWSSGSRVTYRNTQHTPYDPLYHNIQDCAVIVTPTGKWVFRQCQEKHGIVCQFGISNPAGLIG